MANLYDTQFNSNPYLGPCIVALRHTLVNTNCPCTFRHYVFGCGTVVRGDLANTIAPPPAPPPAPASDRVDGERHGDEMRAAHALLAGGHAPLAEPQVVALAGREPANMVHLVGEVYQLTPGLPPEAAVGYAAVAYAQDRERPLIYAVVGPAPDFVVTWRWGPPASLYFP